MQQLIYLIHHYPLALSLILDLIFGDPHWFPHPVKIIGFYAHWLEKKIRKYFPQKLKLGGIVFNLFTVIPVFIITYLIIRVLTILSPLIGEITEIFLIYTTISIKSLIKAGKKVIGHLKFGQIPQSRIALQEIVSRDASQLNKNQIIKGVIETASENSNDGIIAPLFFAILGGAPLAMAYKAINTLDSMIGYKNEKYKDLGWFSAKADDVTNFIPARITGLLIIVASLLPLKHPLLSAKAIRRDSQKGPSPNAGIPICGFAGALDIQLGGPSKQKDGSIADIPYVGGRRKELKFSDFDSAIKLILILPVLLLLGYYLLKS